MEAHTSTPAAADAIGVQIAVDLRSAGTAAVVIRLTDGLSFDVVVEQVRDCYEALGTLHARWNPVPGQFTDHIATPPAEGSVAALHTTVFVSADQTIDVQIRPRVYQPVSDSSPVQYDNDVELEASIV